MNRQIGTVAFVAVSNAPMFPCGEAPAAAVRVAVCRNVAIAAQAAVGGWAASGGMSDRFVAPAAADLTALHDIGLTTGRNDGLAPAAGKAAAHHNVVAVVQIDNYEAALDSSSAPEVDNSPADAIHSSVAAVIDNSAGVQSNCVPDATGIGAGFEAGCILVVAVVLDAWVVIGWVPGVKDAEENHCDDSERGTAPSLMPAS